MKINNTIKTIAMLAFALTVGNVHSAMLDFDDFPGTSRFGSVNEDGFTITGFGTGHYISTGGSSFCGPPCPDNGGNHLLAQSGAYFTITAQNSASFSFFSFDGAEAHQDRQSAWAESIRATGVRADSSLVTQDFTLDFIQDGEGPANDYQFFTATGFTDLVSLTLEGIGNQEWFSADNINLSDVSAVPLPAAAWLFASALLGVAGLCRRGKKAGA